MKEAEIRINDAVKIRRPIWDEDHIATTLSAAIDQVGTFPTQQQLRDLNLGALEHAIGRHGGFSAWRVKFGFPNGKKDSGFWQLEKNIANELQADVENIGRLPTSQELKDAGKSTLTLAMSKTGGPNKWRSFFGLDIEKKDMGYWGENDNIELEIRRVIKDNNLSNFPTASQLKSIGETSLSSAISAQGGFFIWREKFGFSGAKKPNGYWRDPINIENEAAQIVEKYEGSLPSQRVLESKGDSSFLQSVKKYYPGGIVALRQKLSRAKLNPSAILASYEECLRLGQTVPFGDFIRGEYSHVLSPASDEIPTLEGVEKSIPRDKRGRILWSQMSQNPQLLKLYIELQVDEFRKTIPGKSIWAILNDVDRKELYLIIKKFYPGGIKALSKEIGTPQPKPGGYWQNPTNIEKEARALVKQGIALDRNLALVNKSTLLFAVNKYYPGGVRKLRENIGLGQSSVPNGYWTLEKIEEEAQKHLEEHGNISSKTLSGQSGFRSAIGKYYPGGLRNLQKTLGLQESRKAKGFWSKEKTEEATLEFFREHGEISQRLFRLNKRFDLIGAMHKYAGGYRQMRRELGIKYDRKPSGYWTPEKIEDEARSIHQKTGRLDFGAFCSVGKRGNYFVLSESYPGGIRALREKIKVCPTSPTEILDNYDQTLDSGTVIPFQEYLKGEK